MSDLMPFQREYWLRYAALMGAFVLDCYQELCHTILCYYGEKHICEKPVICLVDHFVNGNFSWNGYQLDDTSEIETSTKTSDTIIDAVSVHIPYIALFIHEYFPDTDTYDSSEDYEPAAGTSSNKEIHEAVAAFLDQLPMEERAAALGMIYFFWLGSDYTHQMLPHANVPEESFDCNREMTRVRAFEDQSTYIAAAGYALIISQNMIPLKDILDEYQDEFIPNASPDDIFPFVEKKDHKQFTWQGGASHGGATEIDTDTVMSFEDHSAMVFFIQERLRYTQNQTFQLTAEGTSNKDTNQWIGEYLDQLPIDTRLCVLGLIYILLNGPDPVNPNSSRQARKDLEDKQIRWN